MRYLKITFVRILISFFGANLINELIFISTGRPSMPIIFTILLAALLYYGLTLYVNNRR